jgi:two-component system, OmpR family, phosphate regulon sensor histidine kinase PhoR
VRSPRLSLRILAYCALLLVPVGSATWALAELSSARAVASADSSIDATLRAVVGEYADVTRDARVRAGTLARSRSVQRALARRDRAALRRLRENYPDASFRPSGADGSRPQAGQAVRVVMGSRPVGEVVVGVPLGRALLVRLRRGAVVPPRDVLVLTTASGVAADPPRIAAPTGLRPGAPADVEGGGATYRGLEAPLEGDGHPVRLAVLRPKGPIAAEASDARRRVLYAGLAAFLAVAIIAYAAAPAIGRSRIARESRAQAARILSQVRDGVVLVDEGGIIRSWNQGAERITGVREDEARGHSTAVAVPGFAELLSEVPVATRPEETAQAVTAPLRLGDRELWLSISAVGSEDGIVYAFRDFTDQHKLERMRSEFVATVSHELRTPLASIYGAAMTLRARIRHDDLQKQLIAIVAGEAERLAVIVDEILLASELTSGELALRIEQVDAARLARRAVEAAQPRLPKNLSLEVAEPPSLPPVSADESKARQVLVNLIDNAVKYSPAGGRIELRLERLNGYVVIAVADEGLGIPLSEQEHIFEKFYRLDPDMARGIGGTGLGLYICRELAERMGGKVRVTSSPGAGSTFFFELPLFTSPVARGGVG